MAGISWIQFKKLDPQLAAIFKAKAVIEFFKFYNEGWGRNYSEINAARAAEVSTRVVRFATNQTPHREVIEQETVLRHRRRYGYID